MHPFTLIAPLKEFHMSLSLFRLFGLAGTGLATAALAMPAAVALGQEEREIVIQRVLLDEEEQKDTDDDDDEGRPNYWIGIALAGNEGKESLTVMDVLPDSPALKAGLQAGDLLAAVGDKKLERLEQLMDVIQDSGGKPLELHIVRDGKEVTVHVKPDKRPTESPQPSETQKAPDSGRYTPAPTPPPVASPAIRFPDPQSPDASPSASDRATGGGSAFPPGGGSSARPRTARIAMAFPGSQLPDDMQVTITKKGNRPAVIVAKQGEKLWKTTENGLDMLPPAAQAYAARALGRDVLHGRMPPGGAPGMMPGMGMPGRGSMPGMPGMEGMSGMPGMPGMAGMSGMSGAAASGEKRRIELRLKKDGTLAETQDGTEEAHLKVGPDGRFQIEIREREEKKEGKVQKQETKPVEPAAEKEVPERARRIRELQAEAEKLRALLDQLREEVKEKK